MKRLLRHIRLVPLAEESLGVRSMALYVETPDVRVLFDAGVSLAPRRYGLFPHPLELKAAKEARERIQEYARRADVITISHYHLDHFTPGYKSWLEWTSPETQRELYAEKILVVKHPRENINYNQLRRAHAFLKAVEPLAEKVVYAEGSILEFGETKLRCIGLGPHGPEGSRLGFVAIFALETRGERVIFAPDVQGPISKKLLRMLRVGGEGLLVIGGPPLYLAGKKVSQEDVEKGIKNLKELLLKCPVVTGHHLLRDPEWREPLGETAARVLTYASLAGRDEVLLEAYRRELYEYSPPGEEFEKWLERYRKGDREEPPPL